MPRKITIVCNRCLRATIVFPAPDQDTTSFPRCPICGSRVVDHLVKGEEK
jgi:ribosomal protein S27E